ncbi:Tuberous sclerosis 2-like protein, partial [Vermiconidia calcicola]
LFKEEILTSVLIFLKIAGSREYTVSIPCVHALTICCYEFPDLMSSYMQDVIDKMSKIITQRYLSIHVLLFLAGISRLPDLFKNFQVQHYKRIFGVCSSYLQSTRSASTMLERQLTPTSDRSSKATAEAADALPQYVFALAHHVIAFWYIALKPTQRPEIKAYTTSFLRYTNAEGEKVLDKQGLVTIDLMDSIDAEAEDGNSAAGEAFDSSDGHTTVRHRLAGFLLITTETALRTARTIVTVRRPTDLTKRIIEGPHATGLTKSPPITLESDGDSYLCVLLPEDLDGRTYGRILIPSKTSPLGSQEIMSLSNDDARVTRAIEAIDRIPALDSHKAGVIYIGEAQTAEEDILQNLQGSPDYVEFVEALGSLRRLRGATFNTQGLDRNDDADGEHAIVWNNEITELVFHVTTLMPNNEDIRLNTANKKRHIGNDFVNIIFNNSGAPFDFNTFPSAFNSVYIVITPSARTSFLQTRLLASADAADVASLDSTTTASDPRRDRFCRVQVLTRPGYPAISSAAEEKVISAASLPGYVRNLALNECVFSLMWNSREENKTEYPSSWISRLRQIEMLGGRYGSVLE